MYLEMAGLNSSTFERDFEVTRETLPRRLTKASEQRWRAFSASASARQGEEVIPYSIDNYSQPIATILSDMHLKKEVPEKNMA
jgi:hypothetical protein